MQGLISGVHTFNGVLRHVKTRYVNLRLPARGEDRLWQLIIADETQYNENDEH